MKQTTKEKGFAHVGLIIAVIVIIAAIVLGGWLVWQKDKDSKTSNTNSTNESEKKLPESDKYLIIEEWSLRITLPEDLQGDVSYLIDDKAHRDLGGPIKVDFMSKKFSHGDLMCAEVEGDSPRDLVSIYREVDGKDGETIDPQPFKRLNSTRFYFSTTGCEEAINRDGSPQDKRVLADLKQAIINTLEKAE